MQINLLTLELLMIRDCSENLTWIAKPTVYFHMSIITFYFFPQIIWIFIVVKRDWRLCFNKLIKFLEFSTTFASTSFESGDLNSMFWNTQEHSLASLPNPFLLSPWECHSHKLTYSSLNNFFALMIEECWFLQSSQTKGNSPSFQMAATPWQTSLNCLQRSISSVTKTSRFFAR